jgi:hypothetical protein
MWKKKGRWLGFLKEESSHFVKFFNFSIFNTYTCFMPINFHSKICNLLVSCLIKISQSKGTRIFTIPTFDMLNLPKPLSFAMRTSIFFHMQGTLWFDQRHFAFMRSVAALCSVRLQSNDKEKTLIRQKADDADGEGRKKHHTICKLFNIN